MYFNRLAIAMLSFRILRTSRLENAENFVSYIALAIGPNFPTAMIPTSNNFNLSDSMRVTKNNTNLRGSSALLRELADLVNDLFGSGLQPCGRIAAVGDSRGRNALAIAVQATHLGWLFCVIVDGGLKSGVEIRGRK